MKLASAIIWMFLFGGYVYTWMKNKKPVYLILTLISLLMGVYCILQYGGIA